MQLKCQPKNLLPQLQMATRENKPQLCRMALVGTRHWVQNQHQIILEEKCGACFLWAFGSALLLSVGLWTEASDVFSDWKPFSGLGNNNSLFYSSSDPCY